MLSEVGCCHAVADRSFHQLLGFKNGFRRLRVPRRRCMEKYWGRANCLAEPAEVNHQFGTSHRAPTALDCFSSIGHFDLDRMSIWTHDYTSMVSGKSPFRAGPLQPIRVRFSNCSGGCLAGAMCAGVATLTCSCKPVRDVSTDCQKVRTCQLVLTWSVW